jgi:RNA-binding protein YlmH
MYYSVLLFHSIVHHVVLIASGAFGMSRAKMVKLIESGVVAVAFKPCTNAAQLLQAGQEILVRDHGRLVLQEVGTTAKQK